MMVVVDTRDSTRCVLLFFSKALPGQEHFLVNIDSDAAENELSEVSSTTDCRLVKNHQFACIHVGNKGQVFESKLDFFLSSLFYSFSVTGPHIFC